MNAMPSPQESTSQAWIRLLQIALILASLAISLLPQFRIPAVEAPFLVASLSNFGMMVWHEWKSGRLSMTSSQLLQRAQAGERFPRRPLGVAAVVASSIALWQINMG